MFALEYFFPGLRENRRFTLIPGFQNKTKQYKHFTCFLEQIPVSKIRWKDLKYKSRVLGEDVKKIIE